MKRISFLLVLLSLVCGLRAAATAEKPNIIVILSDDVGLGDIGCFGGHYKTPNIDELASGGTKFTRCYSTPLCGPSRCEMLSGRYPFRTGMVSNRSTDAIKPKNEVMIPSVLKKAGYVTASIGKWSQLPLQPGDFGFDEYFRFPASGRYWRQQTATYNVNGQQKDLPENVYLPELMHDFLIDFITRHKDQPFYVHYPMSHIHGPIVRTPDSKDPSADRPQLYADNVAYMDKLVGKLMAELDRLKLREKTMVIFVGDNGTASFAKDWSPVEGKSISGAKGSMLEGGSRVPMIVNWPGTTPAGKVKDDLIDFSDYLPTLTEIAGAELPKGVTIDGHSFAAQARGEKGEPRDWVYVELNGKRYVRDDRWKLDGRGRLFDLKNAPFEEIETSADASSDAAAAKKKLQSILDKLAAEGSPGKATPGAPQAPDTMEGESPATAPAATSASTSNEPDRATRRERRQQRRARRQQRTQATQPA